MGSLSAFAYFILALVIGYAFVYSPFGEIQALIEEKQKCNESLNTISNIETKKNELLTEFNNISLEDKKNIEVILPDSLNFVRLVSQIDTVAAKYGISIDRIVSREINPSGGDSIEKAEPSKPFKSSIIGFSFSSNYQKFELFMDDLERSLRILDIDSVNLQTQEEGVNQYTVEFKTYWLKS